MTSSSKWFRKHEYACRATPHIFRSKFFTVTVFWNLCVWSHMYWFCRNAFSDFIKKLECFFVHTDNAKDIFYICHKRRIILFGNAPVLAQMWFEFIRIQSFSNCDIGNRYNILLFHTVFRKQPRRPVRISFGRRTKCCGNYFCIKSYQ